MKWFLYNCLFAVAYVAMLPSFLLRMKRRGGYRARFADRFGRYPEEIRARFAGERPLWVHAVSVGEVQVAGQLMRALRERDRSVRFVFSTTSSTGWKVAENELARLKRDGLGRDDDVLIYNPLDFNGCVARALDQIHPRAVILTETEIWPNFIRALRRRGVPVYLVNARISDHSAPRYRALRWFFGEIFRAFTKIYAQSDLDAERLLAAGADAARLAVTGSFKFDVAHRNPAKERELAAWLRAGLGLAADAPLPPILLGGSTWPGEDAALLRIYADLARKHPELVLVIAPRHFEKADAVEACIRAAGFEVVRRSRGEGACARGTAAPVFLADTTGELMGLFGLATVAFVGKSLCAVGGQNMIEPCLCGCAAVVGPHTENFRPVMSDLLAAQAIVQVADEAELARAVTALFDDPAARAAQGARAEAAVARRCGVVGRCADELLRCSSLGI